jgi:Spy/CpxP family protein refolding chaperone
MNRTGRQDARAGLRAPFLRALAFTLLCFAAAAPAASAQEPSPDFVRGRDERPEPEGARSHGRNPQGGLLRRLGLTPEQHRLLREVRRQSESEARALSLRLGEARRALDEAIYAETLDERAVEERARELAAAQGALVRLRARNELRVRQILTPEQLQTFRELRQQARLERRDRRRHGAGGPPAERREDFGPSRRRRP